MALVNTYISHRNVTCPNYLKKKNYKTVLPLIIWWKSNQNKSKTWGCSRSCLHSLKKPDSCQQRDCYPKEMKRRKTLKRTHFFILLTNYYQFFYLDTFVKHSYLLQKRKGIQTYILTTLLHHSTFWLYYSAVLLHTNLLLCTLHTTTTNQLLSREVFHILYYWIY